MENPNLHIESYLDHYLNLKYSPGYAVQLTGKWGVGKTWFIKKYIEEKKAEGFDFLFVSLFGISSYKEIEQSFFQQLHPLLASKGMKLLGKVATGLVKATIKVDLNNDGKTDLDISNTNIDLNIGDYLNKNKSKIIVFDDLERCLIPITNILGYINQIVETQQLKVLILANEDDFLNESNKEPYFKIKEKLISRSFSVKPNLNQALGVFIGLLDNNSARFILKYNDYIKDLYLLADYSNLRHLRQSIEDFGIFYKFLPESISIKKELVEHILYIYFTIQFEIKKGLMSLDRVVDLFSLYGNSLFDNDEDDKDNDEDIVKVFFKKYNQTYFYRSPISDLLWNDFFTFGTIDINQVKISIENSEYYIEENTPVWIKLWNYWNLEDDDLLINTELAFNEFSNKTISDEIILSHLVGIFLLFSENGFLNKTKNEILDIAIQNVNNLKIKKALREPEYSPFGKSGYGKGYHASKTLEFESYYKYLNTAIEESKKTSIEFSAAELVASIKENPETFVEALSIGNSDNNKFYDIPILMYIPIENFCNSFINMLNSKKHLIYNLINKRYPHGVFTVKLKDEYEWLKEVNVNLKKEELGKTVSNLHKEFLIEAIEKAMMNIEIQVNSEN